MIACIDGNKEIIELLLKHPETNLFVKNNENEFCFTTKYINKQTKILLNSKQLQLIQKTTETYILIYFLKEDIFTLKNKKNEKNKKRERFFKINLNLPSELNMRIVNLMFDSKKIFITGKNMNDIFKGYLEYELY